MELKPVTADDAEFLFDLLEKNPELITINQLNK